MAWMHESCDDIMLAVSGIGDVDLYLMLEELFGGIPGWHQRHQPAAKAAEADRSKSHDPLPHQ